MKTKTKNIVFVIFGVLGIIFVSIFDIIAGKPENMIGPKSIIAIAICGLLAVKGSLSLLKKPKA